VGVRLVQFKPLPPGDGCVCLGAMASGVTPYTTLPQVKHAESLVCATGNIRPWQRGQGGNGPLFSTTIIETSGKSAYPHGTASIQPVLDQTL
jgi:hypothetical protein